MNKFTELCEKFGIMQQTKRMFYPKQIKFSDDFIKALKEEYFRQKVEENATTPVQNRPIKFIKALQFHISDFEKNSAQELEAMKRMLSKESTEEFKATTKGDKTQGNKKINSKAVEARRKQIPEENAGLTKKAK